MDMSTTDWREIVLPIHAPSDSCWTIDSSFIQTYPRKRRSFVEWVLRRPKKVIDYSMEAILLVGGTTVASMVGEKFPQDTVTLIAMSNLTTGMHEARLKVRGSPDIKQNGFRIIARAHYQ